MNCVQKTNAEVKLALTNKTFWMGVLFMVCLVVGVVGEVFIFMEVATSFWPRMDGIGFAASAIVVMSMVVVQAMYSIMLFIHCITKDDTDDGSNNTFGG